MSTIPIVELVGRCAAMAATHRRLFEVVGSWVADEPDPDRQRRYGLASHRHAWHAELWDQRSPTIPVDRPPADTSHLTPPDGSAARHDWYRRVVNDLIDETAALAAHVDPLLDPGTLRAAHLVLADLADLAEPTSAPVR